MTKPRDYSVSVSATTPMPTQSSPKLQTNKSVTRLSAPCWKWLTRWVTITRNTEAETRLKRSSHSAQLKRRWLPSTKMTKESYSVSSRVLQISYCPAAHHTSMEMEESAKSTPHSPTESKKSLRKWLQVV